MIGESINRPRRTQPFLRIRCGATRLRESLKGGPLGGGTRGQYGNFYRVLSGPGTTLSSEVRDLFGDPESEYLTEPHKLAGGYSGGDLIWEYKNLGITVVILRDDIERINAKIDEVAIQAPFSEKLECGIFVGLSLTSARDIISRNFKITDEYEDAIYFVPNSGNNMLACVENLATSEVCRIELMKSSTDKAV